MFKPSAGFPLAIQWPGIDDKRMIAIVAELRALLATPTVLLWGRTGSTSANPAIAQSFDVIDSHNANRDMSATFDNWTKLVRSQSKPVWASEDPANWSASADASLPGIVEAVEARVRGLVIWYGKLSLVDDDGRATAKALEIAKHLER
jgi:hypothetical protein